MSKTQNTSTLTGAGVEVMIAVACHQLMTTAKSGERGIRTPGTVARTQHFQCCTIGHSATSPACPKTDSHGNAESSAQRYGHEYYRRTHFSQHSSPCFVAAKLGNLNSGASIEPRALKHWLEHFTCRPVLDLQGQQPGETASDSLSVDGAAQRLTDAGTSCDVPRETLIAIMALQRRQIPEMKVLFGQC